MSVFELPAAGAVYIIALSFVLGLVFGSFCNVWTWRIVHHEKVRRSHCLRCGHTLAAKDLIPLFSWMALKGKCRYCGSPISKRYPITELISGTYYLSILLVYGISIDMLRLWILGSILLVMSLEDMDIMEIEDYLQIFAAAAALFRLTVPGAWKSMLLGLIVPALVLLLVFVMERVLGREVMGGGDIKLLAVLALHFGPLQSVLLLIIACITGLAGAGIAKKGFGKEFPFVPAIAVAAWVTALCGTMLVNAYLSLF